MVRFALVAALMVTPAFATDTPYAGQQNRAVSTFSEADVEALLSGGGWGLAKPAELNGWPGPRHVLDLAQDLDLSADQEQAIQTLFDDMNAKARALGAALIEKERNLDLAFESGEIDPATLQQLLSASEAIRGELRATHLSAHLATAPILSRHQRVIYSRLRGYDAGTDGHNDHSGHN